MYKLGDFGLSNVIKQRDFGQNVAQGTPYYMAPEVWKSELPYNLKSDVWALGVLIYQLMASKYPFDPKGANLTQAQYELQLIKMISNEDYAPLS